MRMRRRADMTGRLEKAGKYFILTEESVANVTEALKTKEYFDLSKIFDSERPLVLEIGCGQGSFACQYATLNPSVNYLALERISNVIITGVERAIASNIPNLRFWRGRAECISKYLMPNSVKKIFLNFSTPLPKQGYAKQRLTSERFLKIYQEILVENGEIEQKTDDRDFFEFSLESLKNNGFEIVEEIRDLHATNRENIVTEYENKFVNMGLPIYYLRARKK